jgi:type IV pilus assembly protein PilB
VRKRIGECLIRAGLISEQDLRLALAEQRRTGERVGTVLVRLNVTTERQLARALAYQLELPYANFFTDPPDPEAIALIPHDVASKRLSVGTRLADNQLTVAMADPLLFGLIEDLETRTGRRIMPAVAARTDILHAIHTGYSPRHRLSLAAAERPIAACAKCRRGLEPGWRFCPVCAASVGGRPAKSDALPDAASM